MSLINVDGFSNLKKDSSSGGVINVDSVSYKNYKQSRTLALQKFEEQQQTVSQVQQLENEINTIKCDLSDIKSILQQLLEKGK